MTNQTPAPDGEWLESMFETISGLRANDFEAEWFEFRSMMAAHDQQLLDRIEGALPEKLDPELSPAPKAHKPAALTANRIIDQVKTILKDIREGL